MSSDCSESLSEVSLPPVGVEFPPTPVFTDQIPEGIIRKLELLSVAPQTPKTLASRSSHTVSATQSLDTIHDEASSSIISSDSNSTSRQQQTAEAMLKHKIEELEAELRR